MILSAWSVQQHSVVVVGGPCLRVLSVHKRRIDCKFPAMYRAQPSNHRNRGSGKPVNRLKYTICRRPRFQ
jgi:hypothetical protein